MPNLPSGYSEPESLDNYFERTMEDLADAYSEINRLKSEITLLQDLLKVAYTAFLNIAEEPSNSTEICTIMGKIKLELGNEVNR